jgi:FkbM family methyltransferase
MSGAHEEIDQLLGAARRRASSAKGRLTALVRDQSPLPPHLTGDRSALEAFSHQHSRAIYLGDETVLCRVLGKYLMYVDALETGIAPHLCLDGYWESWITVALSRTLRRDWHCLDIGANHGYYTMVMADAVGPGGRVAPIEPTPRLAHLLRQTLDVNGFPHVNVEQKAASDADGNTLQLVIPRHRSLNARVSDVAGPDDSAVDVGSVTVDTLTSEWPRVDLIKIDVEGAEEAVWRGMERTIAANPKLVVILEFNSARYEDPRGFLNAIQQAGFPLRYIDLSSEAVDVSVKQLLTTRIGEDWMLYLARG